MALNLKKSFGLDPNKSVNGVLVDYEEGARLLIASSRNPKYREEIRRGMEPHLQRLRRGRKGALMRITEEVQMDAASKHLLLGWEEIVDEEGNPETYTPEIGLKAFHDSMDFFDDVMQYADDLALFQLEQTEEDLKN